jgi:hypothetical protein
VESSVKEWIGDEVIERISIMKSRELGKDIFLRNTIIYGLKGRTVSV